MLDRLNMLFLRRKRAGEIGVVFNRAANFDLPTTINLDGKPMKLNLPKENGVKVAFIDLLLDDCYGCYKLSKSSSNVTRVLDIGANVELS